MKAEVHFLGQPRILINGKKIQITQKKIEAMLLYLLFNGQCTREELVAVFWCGCDGESARRNLRNSIYKIRNLIGKDFLLAGGKSYISLNPQLLIERDIDLFVMENSEEKIIELSSFCFLDKVFLKNCPEFEEWVRGMQNTYERILLGKLIPGMRSCMNKGATVLAEKYAECILRADAHNEEAILVLMQLCEQNSDYNRAASIYSHFSKQLLYDLGLEPGMRIKEEYENILRLKSEKRRSENEGLSYAGHIHALVALEEEYSRYRQGFAYNNLILCGAEGMYKEEIWWEFSKAHDKEAVINLWFSSLGDKVDYYAVRCTLIKIGEWMGIAQSEILAGIPVGNADLNFMNSIDKLAGKIPNSGRKCRLIIHNMEHADVKSRNLILTCLMERMKQKVFIAAGFCSNSRKKFPLLFDAAGFSGIRVLHLEPLAEGECSRYFMECLQDGKIAKLEERKLYRYTGGNLMLIRQAASNFQDGCEDIYLMHSQAEQCFGKLFQTLDVQEYEYLEYLAVLENGAEAEVLGKMCHENSFSVMQEMTLLLGNGFFEEVPQRGHERLRIRSKMLRDMIYKNISDFRKKELHKSAVCCYEVLYKNSERDLFILSELKYHSAPAGRPEAALFYSIAYLRYVLDYYDEFFPAVPHDVEILSTFSFTRKEIYEELDDFQIKLAAMENRVDEVWFNELQMELYYLRGRTLNRDGKRDAGLIYAEKLITLAERTNHKKMLINGFIEALCFGVKAEDSQLMENYLEKVKRLSDRSDYPVEYGTLLRLEGYCCILNKDYDRAEMLLKKSIGIFDSPRYQNTYYYCAAGAYDYLALTYRFRKQYDNALKVMEKALALCTERNVKKGMDLFYEDYGYILFLQGRHDEAERYFILSAGIYDEFGTYWLRSIGESCMSMICLERGKEKEALEYFRRAEIFSRKEKTKEEMVVLETARRKLKKARVLV